MNSGNNYDSVVGDNSNSYGQPTLASDYGHHDMSMGNGNSNNSGSAFAMGGSQSLNSSSTQNASGSMLHQRFNFVTTKVKEFKDTRLQNTRDWMLFVGKREKYGLPTMSTAPERVKENIIYFQTNYLILFFIFATYVIITKPLFLFLLVLLALISIYMNYVNPELPEIYKKIGFGIQVFLSIYFLLSAGSSIVWLIGASISIVLLHAAFHVPQSTDDSQLQFGS
ncbi:hypothetical protein SAMD00019534_037660, partial [Acytostelium subglobosum LB1]|uniref:hypothetical protein n=1 Tax=Acytostelium subglobosum LB1 TaxID=1410327 RepID=UPI0006448898